jgi:hypothetical protein
MTISPTQANSSTITTDSVDTIKSSTESTAIEDQSTKTTKTDAALISEKAKDLAALKADKQAQEEVNESAPAKNREAIQDSSI